MAVEIKEVSESELPELTTRGKVLVDFYSKTCGPCKMLAFVLKDIAKGLDDTEILLIDFDQNKEAVESHAVEGYPTIIFYKDGKEVERMRGLQQKPVILQMISA